LVAMEGFPFGREGTSATLAGAIAKECFVVLKLNSSDITARTVHCNGDIVVKPTQT